LVLLALPPRAVVGLRRSRLRGQKVGHPGPRAHGPVRESAKERARRLATELPGARLDRGMVERAGRGSWDTRRPPFIALACHGLSSAFKA
jgi:hypothetical protein